MLNLPDFFKLNEYERMKSPTPFSDDFQDICALITHLGAHEKWQSRPPSEIAFSLSMKKEKVDRILNYFTCFFRKSGHKNNGEELFTVHLRYARRKVVNGEQSSEPMNPEKIGILINTLM